jgi:hypothetical protein
VHYVQDNPPTKNNESDPISKLPAEGRIIALDPGTKRIGVAVCDELRITTRPLPMIARTSWKTSLKKIEDRLAELDAVAVVVSEETGAISICHRRRIERNFTPETFRQRLGEILLHRYHEEADPEQLARETDLPPARDRALVSHQEERSNDTLTV